MAVNRIRRPAHVASVPSTAQPAFTGVPHGFVVCPAVVATAASWQQEIYRAAYQKAQAAAQIPRHYRLLFSVWN